MKVPNWFKIVWWILLVVLFSYFFVQRYEFIMSGSVTAADIVILLILSALITIPLFHEVNIFGVGFKKENDNPRPSPDSKLLEIRKMAEATLKEELGEPIVKQTPTPDVVPNDVLNLFAVRYNIENELNRLTDVYWMSEDKKFYPNTIIQKLEYLIRMKVIHPNLARILKEMYAQSSTAIHGEQISQQATQWVMQDAASTIQVLKGIPPEPAAATKVQR